MVDALKKMDKKLLIIAFCIIVLPIVFVLFLILLRGCSDNGISYSSYEEKMVAATKKYLEKEKIKLSDEGSYEIVNLDILVDKKYIKSASKLLKDDSCTGFVSVRRNGSSIEENKGGYLNYIVNLSCNNYKTAHLVDKIKENITNSESGLYLFDGIYVFKGDKPSNYLNIFDKSYRIVSIDENNILKLVSDPTGISRIWDNKYNIEIDHNYGINLYKDSSILSYIVEEYKNKKKYPINLKEKMMAYDVCIGKRSSSDFSISRELDCSSRLPKQLVSLPNVSDYALASYDPDCKDIKSKACKNYNYLSLVASSTWTLNAASDNTYQAFVMSDGIAYVEDTNTYNEYNTVIYIDGNELYQEGTGTKTNPYLIK
ncbi:MAG: hypothetical protein Q4E75_03995 [bacterium]|nr:hypothetical protein [bacterium]